MDNEETRARERVDVALGGSRREFLKMAGIAAAAVAAPAVLAGCATFPFGHGSTLNFDQDWGVLNYAYVLETIEADFYNLVIKSPPPDLRPGELDVLKDIAVHESVHRRFFKRALGPFAIQQPATTFATIDLRSRSGVLNAAKTFEDLGVAAYNGAGKRLKLAEFLTIAGKIVSVEARHAAAIRDLLAPLPRDFVGDDIVDERGLDRALPPEQVLDMAAPFLKTQVTAINL
ncbi:MAG: ferritin-like domain-containing protein [Gemmatimonadaceae bacterium]